MGVLSRLWVSMRTQDREDAGTDSPIVLIINEGGVDKLHHTFPDTSQDDQERGQANLYEIDVEGREIRSEHLTNSSFRLAIGGSDLWHPQHVLVWGQESNGGQVVPLALEFNIASGISADASEGNLSFPLRRIGFPTVSPVVGLPDTKARIKQILVVLTTADVSDAGTDSEIELEITFGGGEKWIQNIRNIVPGNTPQEDLETGKANFYLPITRQSLGAVRRRNNLESVVLRIKGDDSWLPGSFFLFGFTRIFFDPDFSGQPRPDSIMPLVHIPNWDLGALSKDRSEGQESVALPLLPPPNISPDLLDVTPSTTS